MSECPHAQHSSEKGNLIHCIACQKTNLSFQQKCTICDQLTESRICCGLEKELTQKCIHCTADFDKYRNICMLCCDGFGDSREKLTHLCGESNSFFHPTCVIQQQFLPAYQQSRLLLDVPENITEFPDLSACAYCLTTGTFPTLWPSETLEKFASDFKRCQSLKGEQTDVEQREQKFELSYLDDFVHLLTGTARVHTK